MVVECNIYCRSMNAILEEDLGIQDPGIWLPAVIDFAQVESVKLSTDDSEDPTYNMASLYMKSEGSYATDIPFTALKRAFIKYKGGEVFKYQPQEPTL